MHDDGYIEIAGRLKELIITAGGENIAPLPIEDNVKRELPGVVSNVVVIGDGKKYLTCLLTLKVTVDPATAQPTDNLEETVIEWCQEQGVGGLKTMNDLLTSDKKQVRLWHCNRNAKA